MEIPGRSITTISMIKGISYKLGGEFLPTSSLKRVRVTVNNVLKNVQVSNVIATIRGSVEPDRYVILGNSR